MERTEDEEMLWNEGLLTISEGLHGAITGACDGVPDAELGRRVQYLTRRLVHWTAPAAPWAAFDEAVKRVVQAVLTEADRE